MRVILAAAALAILAACGGAGGGPGGGGDMVDSCDARAQQRLVGTRIDDPAAASALAPKVRLVYPDSAITEDLQPDRLNVVMDGNNRVTRVYCG